MRTRTEKVRQATTDPVIQAVLKAQKEHNLFPQPTPSQRQRLLVAVSGGADSVCLLHVLLQLCEALQLDLHVAHIDHGLRPDSAADANFVRKLAEQWVLPFHLATLAAQATPPNHGIEAWARDARYEKLWSFAAQICSGQPLTLLAVAHHADDQAETILMNLTRGSGLRGASGMRHVSHHDTGRNYLLLRPLLDVRRTEILRYLNEHGLVWREDSTNQDLSFTRNRIRHVILPELEKINPQVVEALNRFGHLAHEMVERVEPIDRKLVEGVLIDNGYDHDFGYVNPIIVNLERLRSLSESEQRAILNVVMRDYVRETQPYGTFVTLTFEHLNTLVTALKTIGKVQAYNRSLVGNMLWSTFSKRKDQPATLKIYPNQLKVEPPPFPHLWQTALTAAQPLLERRIFCGRWQLSVKRSQRRVLLEWSLQETNEWCAWLDADKVFLPALTTPQPGMQFDPLGMAGKHKSLGDFFTDQKVPIELRAGWPLVIDQQSGKIVWVCGQRIAEHAKVTDQTIRILYLHWEELDNDKYFEHRVKNLKASQYLYIEDTPSQESAGQLSFEFQ